MAPSRREKLSDIYGTVYAQNGQQIPFAKLYPEIDDLSIEIEEVGGRPLGSGGRVQLSKTTYSIVHDCPNPQCALGGIRIDPLVSQMVHARKTANQLELKCVGYEGSPKGARFYGCCDIRFKVNIAMRYKGEEKSRDRF